MIYLTGDTHGNFKRFSKRQRSRWKFQMSADDYLIICGDFGLVWADDKEFLYNCNWLSSLPFTILWVQGNHENYDMISEYPIEEWHEGKVRHIVRDKIILLERGQTFNIDGKTFFTFGGATTRDIQGGILDRNDRDFNVKRRNAIKSNLPFRILHESWWSQEIPSEEEMQEGIKNLEKVNYQVDYVITHCCATSIQESLSTGYDYNADKLTNYFEKIERKIQYKQWYFGHYHADARIDDKHTLIYKEIIALN